MKVHIENTVPLEGIQEHLINLFGWELKEYKKIEIELRANVGVYRYLLDDTWDEIWGRLSGPAMFDSTCEKWYTDKNIKSGDCYYSIWIYHF